MNDQPSHPQFRPSSFGAPPSGPTGAGRMLPFIRTAMTGGFIVALGLYGAQLVLPEPYKPSVVAGWAAGLTVRSETEAMREVKLDYERRLADANAQANAKAQVDVVAITKAVEERTQGLAGLSTAAAVADWACLGGKGVANATQPSMGSDWRRPDTGGDWHSFAQAIAGATCGLGNTLREDVTQGQLAAAREAAAARGAPMTNGAVQVTSPPPLPAAPPAVTGAVEPVQRLAPVVVPHWDASRPMLRYGSEDRDQLRAYAESQPVAVRQAFTAGLDNHATNYWSEFYNRVGQYRDAHPKG